jgi:hypothetical protein
MRIVDKVLFMMPEDRELQFPAISVLQSYVNNFDQKMAANDVSPNHSATYELQWDAVIGVEVDSLFDMNFFKEIGLGLSKPRVPITRPDVILDFREHRLLPFANTDRHVCQVYGLFAGIATSPLPKIRQVNPFMDATFRWAVLQTHFPVSRLIEDKISYELPLLNSKQLIRIVDNEWSGVIGYASWETYLACSYGIPTIEIVGPDRNTNWLSKWSNPLYRICESAKPNLPVQIYSAMKNIEAALTYVRTRETREAELANKR